MLSSTSAASNDDSVNNKGLSQESLKKGEDLQECVICLSVRPLLSFPKLKYCSHRACYKCLKQYLTTEITEGRVNISCPKCPEPLHPTDIYSILDDENLLEKYEAFMLRKVLFTVPDARWCPAPDCGYAVIVKHCTLCPKLKCERPGCNTYFCYYCKQKWPRDLATDIEKALRADQSSNTSTTSAIEGRNIKPCPRCKVLILKKDYSCNLMTCSICEANFCWMCRKEVSRFHYFGGTGCPYFGKEPTSRGEKIMFLSCLLIGAPIIIPFLTVLVVLLMIALIVDISKGVGRTLYKKYSRPETSRHIRNLIVIAGVLLSIPFSILVAVSGIGMFICLIPALLAIVFSILIILIWQSSSNTSTTTLFDEEYEIGISNNITTRNVLKTEKTVTTKSV